MTVNFSLMSEAHVQAIAVQQALLTVRQLRCFGWMFAAVLVYGHKAPRGIAGASYFDWPISQLAYAGPLVAAGRAMVADMERAAARHGALTDDASGTNFQTITGSSVVETRLLAHMRLVDDALLDSVGNRLVEFGELALACRAEQERRRVARLTGAPEP